MKVLVWPWPSRYWAALAFIIAVLIGIILLVKTGTLVINNATTPEQASRRAASTPITRASAPTAQASGAVVAAPAVLPAPVASKPAIPKASAEVTVTEPPPVTSEPAPPAKTEVKVVAESEQQKKPARRPKLSEKPAAVPTQPTSAVEPGASGGFRWVHFGRDPYASSRDEAMRMRESAFRAMGLPEAVMMHLMFATDKPGEKARISVGDHLDVMLSKGGAAHKNVTVAFASPVRGMEYTAPAERWQVTWEGKTYTVLLPEVCNNWSLIIGPAPISAPPVAATPPAAPVALAPPPIVGTCPNVYTLKLNVWTPSVLRLPGVAQTVAKEAMEVNGFSNLADFSRKHGGQVRKAEASGNPDGKRSETTRRFRISFINTDEARGGSSAITAEEVLYDVAVTGLIEMRFAKVELQKWDAIRTVSLDHDVQSPPTFGKTGLHELRFFNRLPGKSLGEWDNNPVPDCIMNEHAIEGSSPVPPARSAANLPQ